MRIMARALKKNFKSKKFDPKKFDKKGSSSKKNERSSNGNKPLNNKNDSNLGPCFGHGLPVHVVKDCPILQTKLENASKMPRKNSRNQ